jgi:hypothetical protein
MERSNGERRVPPPAVLQLIPAATYSPRQLPTKYHRRKEA